MDPMWNIYNKVVVKLYMLLFNILICFMEVA